MVTLEEGQFIFNHVFLPPKVPTESDDDISADVLLDEVSDVASTFSSNLDVKQQQRWNLISHSIERWRVVYALSGFDRESAVSQLKYMGVGETLLLNIKCQNAALLIHKDRSGLVFHAFEVAPTTNAILDASGSVIRSFPAHSIFIGKDIQNDQEFITTIVEHLHMLAQEQTSLSLESVTKAGRKVQEARQTEHPRLITQWLLGVLAARGGRPILSTSVTKRTRDEVSWEDALKPWRRSPMWLCVRVGLQLTLEYAFKEGARDVYKLFMMTLMCHFSKNLISLDPSLDNLHVVREKLARRHAKMMFAVPVGSRQYFMRSIQAVKHCMNELWETTKHRATARIPRVLHSQLDCGVALTTSRDALQEVLMQHRSRTTNDESYPPVPPSFAFSFSSTELPDSSALCGSGEDTVEVLFACNEWVRSNLKSWVRSNPSDGPTCSALNRLICRYFESSRAVFSKDAELMSISILTILELWIVLDGIALSSCPLLSQFSPEIPDDVFFPLKLSRSEDLHRLAAIEQYLVQRQGDCDPKNPSIFDDPSPQAFGARYFESSARLRSLLDMIMMRSATEKIQVLQAYHEKKSRYEEMVKSAQAIARCDKIITRHGFSHDFKCKKCARVREANQLAVRKYEEPLPEKIWLRHVVVFELDPPEQFLAWRDATHFILQDVLRTSMKTGPDVKQKLVEYTPLAPYHKHSDRRVGLGSHYKAFAKSHYIRSEISTTIEEELFMPHGLDHKFQDQQNPSIWTKQQEPLYSLAKFCRPKLPPGPYNILLETLSSSHRSQNGIMARQSQCPISLSVQEFVAFGSMRCGENLGLLNVLRMFLAHEIDLNSMPAVVLLEQILHEAGNPAANLDQVLRSSHQEMHSSPFLHHLLSAVDILLEKITANWKEIYSMRCCLLVVQRAASLSAFTGQQTLARSILMVKRIRQTTVSWTIQLAEKSLQARQDALTSTSMKELQRRVLDSALLTLETWNFEKQFQPLLLCSQSDVADYVATLIIISDYGKLCQNTKDGALHRLMIRSQVTALECETTLRDSVRQNGLGVSIGIQRYWKDLVVEPSWIYADGADSLWVSSKTPTNKPVHWHVLTGILLVGGRPVSILPDDYSQSHIYKQIFEDRVVDVITSDRPWMDFMTTSLVERNRVYFGKRNGDHVIQTTCNGATFEALRRSLFRKDLPTTIVAQTQPWLCLEDGHVELRSGGIQQEQPQKFWTIDPPKASNGTYIVRRGKQYLVDSTGSFGRGICNIFRDFEDEKYLEITHEAGTALKVSMPRYHLTFSLHTDSGKFRCMELAAEVDDDTSIGCLYGLRSRLVLSGVNASPYDKRRYILIPYGPVSAISAEKHLTVTVHTQGLLEMKFFQYKINHNLGQIDADGNFEAHLFKAYLHAVTSSCLKDPLTGKTGVAEALSALQDTVTLTSVPVSETANEILKMILSLTPLRQFYPDPRSRTLQKVEWHPSLSVFAQHEAFADLATNIATHSIMANFIYDKEKQSVPEYQGDHHLWQRALWRTARYHATDQNVVGEATSPTDVVYQSRGNEQSESQLLALRTATSVFSWSASGPVESDLYAVMTQYEHVSGFMNIFAPVNVSDLLSIDMKVSWPALMTFCTTATREDVNLLAIQLSLVIFGNPQLSRLVQTLVAFAICRPLKTLGPPENMEYDLTLGESIDDSLIASYLDEHFRTNEQDEELLHADDSSQYDVEADLAVNLQIQRSLVRDAVHASWHGARVAMPDEMELPNFDHKALTEVLDKLLASWKNNARLYEQCKRYATELVKVDLIRSCHSMPHLDVQRNESWTQSSSERPVVNVMAPPSLLEAFKEFDTSRWNQYCPRLTIFDRAMSSRHDSKVSSHVGLDPRASQLMKGLLERSYQCHEPAVVSVARDLAASLYALEQGSKVSVAYMELPNREYIQREFTDMQNTVQAFMQGLSDALAPTDDIGRAFRSAGLWPEVEVRALLELLQSSCREQLDEAHLEILFNFALAICSKQRLARILHFMHIGDNFALRKEVENEAHEAWDVHQYPDWLLLELQNDFLIRPAQVTVAEEIIRPRNGIVQLGMGEGKTSVILPMAITALSDGKRLVRVVVLKSLANEMLRSVSRNLSGLVNRPLYYLPFSRSTRVTRQMLKTLSVIRDDCKDRKGVLLALPEHLNSFRLMANDKVVTRESGVREMMLGMQKGLDNSAIDILDECDEILHPRNELVYTSGTPRPLSGAPERWNTLLDLLFLVERNIGDAAHTFPSSFEYVPTSIGCFPRVRVLRSEGYDYLQMLLLQDVEQGHVSSLRFDFYDDATVKLAFKFIQDPSADGQVINVLRQKLRKDAELDCLYLLRGLIAMGNLKAALERRWFVHYGLDRGRSLAAVPYRAKSTPASAAEFAQPDMMILLTSLSYFYTGIDVEDMRRCIALLVRSADAGGEFSRWKATADIPMAYRNVNALNPDSDMCVESLHKSLRMNKDAISFFLRRIVFPREAKEFPQKLCSSAWDLCVEGIHRFVTGFSGTCDALMPLTMPRQDISDLQHYDAAVLMDLLKERNQHYICASQPHGLSEVSDLLVLISCERIRSDVIIDVGAQILDLNISVAKQWLSLRQDGKLACVFFDDNDEKTVVTRDGTVESWNSSPYKEQVDKCLIFMDQFHTRGTDFQLPDSFTAALLLGPKLSLDSLVQASMRMRKLSFSQSLVFIGTREVEDSIRATLHVRTDQSINTIDIIEWSIRQSCLAKEQQRPLWVDRGLSFFQRHYAFENLVSSTGSVPHPDSYLRAVLQDESHEVSKIYGSPSTIAGAPGKCPYKVDDRNPMVKELLAYWETTHFAGSLSCFQEQEQEREVLHEVEQEREVERPNEMNAQRIRLDEDLHNIIVSNRIARAKPESLKSAFDILEYTSLRRAYSKSQWPPYLLATHDFLYPVKVADGSDLDDFLRPVTWLLVLRGLPHIILISCHEANAWKDDIKRSSVATLIMYHPRIRLETASFDSLNVYPISAMPDVSGVDPKALLALRLFSGQLYFNDFQEYTEFCSLVGLWNGKTDLKGQIHKVEDSNYVPYKIRQVTAGWTGKWRTNPVEMIKKFIGMRRLNEEWEHTHVGRVLNGQRLTEKDFL